MTADLLSCPFCGGSAERIDFGPGSGDNEGGSCIACTKCQSSGPVEFGYKENFVSNWNRRALSHVAGQDGEQCRAASWDADFAKMDAVYNFLMGISDLGGVSFGERHPMVRGQFWWRHDLAAAYASIHALSRGVPEDTRRMDWLVANVTEKLTAKSIQGEFPYPEHKTQYVLPRLIAWADFHGQVGFREAIDAAIAAQRKEGA